MFEPAGDPSSAVDRFEKFRRQGGSNMENLFSPHTKTVLWMLGSKSLGDIPKPYSNGTLGESMDSSAPKPPQQNATDISCLSVADSSTSDARERRPSATSLNTKTTDHGIDTQESTESLSDINNSIMIPESTRRYALPTFSRGSDIKTGLASISDTVDGDMDMSTEQPAPLRAQTVNFQIQKELKETISYIQALNLKNHQILCAYLRKEFYHDLGESTPGDKTSMSAQLQPAVLGLNESNATTSNLLSLVQLIPDHLALCSMVLEDPLREFFIFLVLHRILAPMSVDPSTTSTFLSSICVHEARRLDEHRDRMVRKYGLFFNSSEEVAQWNSRRMPLLKGTSSLSAVLGQYSHRCDVLLYFRGLWGKALTPLLDVVRDNDAYNDRRNGDPLHVAKLRIAYVTQTLKIVRKVLDIFMTDESLAAFPSPAATVCQLLNHKDGFEPCDVFLIDLMVLPSVWSFLRPFDPFPGFVRPTYSEGHELWSEICQKLQHRLQRPWTETPESNIAGVCFFLWFVFHSGAHERPGSTPKVGCRKLPTEMHFEFMMESEIETRVRSLVDRYRSRIKIFRKKITQLPTSSDIASQASVSTSETPLQSNNQMMPSNLGGSKKESIIIPRTLLRRRIDHLCPRPREMTSLIVASRAELDGLIDAINSAHTLFLEHKELYIETIRDPLVTSLHSIIVNINLGERHKESDELHRVYLVHKEVTPIPWDGNGSVSDGGPDDASVVTFASVNPEMYGHMEKLRAAMKQASGEVVELNNKLILIYRQLDFFSESRYEMNTHTTSNISHAVSHTKSSKTRQELSPGKQLASSHPLNSSYDHVQHFMSILRSSSPEQQKREVSPVRSKAPYMAPTGSWIESQVQGTVHPEGRQIAAVHETQNFIQNLRADGNGAPTPSHRRRSRAAARMKQTLVEQNQNGFAQQIEDHTGSFRTPQHLPRNVRDSAASWAPESSSVAPATSVVGRLALSPIPRAENGERYTEDIMEEVARRVNGEHSVSSYASSSRAYNSSAAREEEEEKKKGKKDGNEVAAYNRSNDGAAAADQDFMLRIKALTQKVRSERGSESATASAQGSVTSSISSIGLRRAIGNETSQNFNSVPAPLISPMENRAPRGELLSTSKGWSTDSKYGTNSTAVRAMKSGIMKAPTHSNPFHRENIPANDRDESSKEEALKTQLKARSIKNTINEAKEAKEEASKIQFAARSIKNRIDEAKEAKEALEATSAADGEERWQKGFTAKKHGRRGKPKVRYVQIDQNQTVIQWSSQNKNVAQALIGIADVTEVRKGMTTEILKRYGKAESASTYFSVIARSRSLDLEVESEEIRDNLVRSLNKIVNSKDPNSS